jgi:hypothetical protein
VIFFHFEITSSGDNRLLTGKPWPPACCQRVCAAHPPETSNKEPVVLSLSKDSSQVCMENPLEQQTFANEIANNRCNKVRLRKSSTCVQHGSLECLTLKASTISCGLRASNEGYTGAPQRKSTYQMVCVIAVPAEGARALAKILYFFPSMAMARVKPIIAAFAVE